MHWLLESNRTLSRAVEAARHCPAPASSRGMAAVPAPAVKLRAMAVVLAGAESHPQAPYIVWVPVGTCEQNGKGCCFASEGMLERSHLVQT